MFLFLQGMGLLFQQSIGCPLKIAAQRIIVGMELTDNLKQDFCEWAKPGVADSQI